MTKQGRLHLRLDTVLSDKIRAYAQRRHTTVTALVEQYFLQLLDEENQLAVQSVEPAEQI